VNVSDPPEENGVTLGYVSNDFGNGPTGDGGIAIAAAYNFLFYPGGWADGVSDLVDKIKGQIDMMNREDGANDNYVKELIIRGHGSSGRIYIGPVGQLGPNIIPGSTVTLPDGSVQPVYDKAVADKVAELRPYFRKDSKIILQYAGPGAARPRGRAWIVGGVAGALVVPVSVLIAVTISGLGGGNTAVASAYVTCSLASVGICAWSLRSTLVGGQRGAWIPILGIVSSLIIPGILSIPSVSPHRNLPPVTRPAPTTTLGTTQPR
jgi:hypothetical protein